MPRPTTGWQTPRGGWARGTQFRGAATSPSRACARSQKRRSAARRPHGVSMRRLVALALSLIAVSTIAVAGARSATAQGAAPSFASGQPLVMALYYPWYDESTWDSGMTADRPLVPYASWQRETIE